VFIFALRRALKRPAKGIVMNLERYLIVAMLIVLAGLLAASAMS